jgi:ribose transport system substrate-binding protein
MRNHVRLAVTAAVWICAAAGLAACGSSSSTSSTRSTSTTASSSASTSSTASAAAAVTYAKQQLAAHEALATTFAAPGPPIKGGKAAYAGKTIWYIPITAVPPFFAITTSSLKQVAAKLGVTLRVCDAQVTPTGASSCLREAVASNPGAIITDAIPIPFAQDAYTAPVNAKIPVIGGYVVPPGPTNGNFAKYFTPVSGFEEQAESLGADVMIADSAGKGNFLMTIDSDIPSSITASEAAVNEVKQHCPQCIVATYSVKANGNPNLASTVSSEILSHPNAQYFYVPYEDPSGTTFIQGLRESGRTLKLMAMAGDTAGLGRVAAGTQLGDVLLDPVSHAWELMDAALRGTTGTPPAAYVGLNRVFIKGNIPTNLTVAGWASGRWFSDLSFETVFEKLWGLS